MKNPSFIRFLVSLGLVCALAVSARAASIPPSVESLGNNTFSVTNTAKTGFMRDTDKLKEEALDVAKAYCASHNKQIKVISVEAHRPKVMFMAYAEAKVVFKALEANDPELRMPVAAVGNSNGSAAGYAPAPSSTDALYADLMKLDDLRKKGVLTDEEFQAEKKKVLNRSN